jgi:hypothetical protein
MQFSAFRRFIKGFRTTQMTRFTTHQIMAAFLHGLGAPRSARHLFAETQKTAPLTAESSECFEFGF